MQFLQLMTNSNSISSDIQKKTKSDISTFYSKTWKKIRSKHEKFLSLLIVISHFLFLEGTFEPLCVRSFPGLLNHCVYDLFPICILIKGHCIQCNAYSLKHTQQIFRGFPILQLGNFVTGQYQILNAIFTVFLSSRKNSSQVTTKPARLLQYYC